MSEADAQHATRVVPLMRYRDLPKAITWLSDAFGFEVHYTASDDDGKLIYAQMVYGNGMVMLGPVRDSDFDDLLSQPDEIGGTETQSCYLVVEDVENHYGRAKEAGAEIALEVQSDETGGRAYSCRDYEGHLWNFGTFNPWQSASVGSSRALTPVTDRGSAGPLSLARSAAAVFAGLAIAGVAIGIYSNHQQPTDRISNMRVVDPETVPKPEKVGLPTAPIHVVASLRKELQQERTARRDAEQRLAMVRRELAAEKAKGHEKVAVTRRAQEELAEARSAEKAALATVERLRSQHLRERQNKNASVEDLHKLIEAERAAKDKALKEAEDMKLALVRERQLRQKAERNAAEAEDAARDAQHELQSAKVTPRAVQSTPSLKPALGKKKTGPKVTAVERPTAKKNETNRARKVTPKRAVKKKVTKTPARKKVARKKYTPKKKVAPKKKRAYGSKKGWPYDTW